MGAVSAELEKSIAKAKRITPQMSKEPVWKRSLMILVFVEIL